MLYSFHQSLWLRQPNTPVESTSWYAGMRVPRSRRVVGLVPCGTGSSSRLRPFIHPVQHLFHGGITSGLDEFRGAKGRHRRSGEPQKENKGKGIGEYKDRRRHHYGVCHMMTIPQGSPNRLSSSGGWWSWAWAIAVAFDLTVSEAKTKIKWLRTRKIPGAVIFSVKVAYQVDS